MIFPQLGPTYYDEKHKDVLAKMEAFYAQSITINQSFWGEADIDTRFETGDQTLWTDLYGNLPANRRVSILVSSSRTRSRLTAAVFGASARMDAPVSGSIAKPRRAAKRTARNMRR